MEVSYAPAFLRVLAKLDAPFKEAVKDSAGKVIDFYEGRQKTTGLGIKRLRRELWEARAGLGVRVVYSLSGNHLRFILAGNHNDIQRFLRQM